MNTKFPSQDETCDVLVVGAGVVGCAVTRRLALEGARVILAEKAGDVLDGASKGNSAILHTGFDAPPGSVEQACISEGYREFQEIHGRLGLPLLVTGERAMRSPDQGLLPTVAWQFDGGTPDTDRAGDGVEGAVHSRSVWPDTPWTRGSSLKFHPV